MEASQTEYVSTFPLIGLVEYGHTYSADEVLGYFAYNMICDGGLSSDRRPFQTFFLFVLQVQASSDDIVLSLLSCYDAMMVYCFRI